MNLQYISDNKGKKTGVFIPIDDWKILQKHLSGLVELDGLPGTNQGRDIGRS
jgi:hypothetical protein